MEGIHSLINTSSKYPMVDDHLSFCSLPEQLQQLLGNQHVQQMDFHYALDLAYMCCLYKCRLPFQLCEFVLVILEPTVKQQLFRIESLSVSCLGSLVPRSRPVFCAYSIGRTWGRRQCRGIVRSQVLPSFCCLQHRENLGTMAMSRYCTFPGPAQLSVLTAQGEPGGDGNVEVLYVPRSRPAFCAYNIGRAWEQLQCQGIVRSQVPPSFRCLQHRESLGMMAISWQPCLSNCSGVLTVRRPVHTHTCFCWHFWKQIPAQPNTLLLFPATINGSSYCTFPGPAQLSVAYSIGRAWERCQCRGMLDTFLFTFFCFFFFTDN